MKRYFQIALTLLLFLGVSACSPASPAAQEVTPTSQATAAGAYHPLTTRTGIAEIDNILEVVASGDTEAFHALIQFTRAQCTQRDGLGGPPKCRDGEAEGTPVEVLPFLGPEGSYLRKEEIGNWPGFEAAGLYAIYEVSPDAYSDENNPAGKYALMYFDAEKESVISLRVEDGKIVRLDYNFDISPEVLNGWLQREASKVILAPLTR